MNIDKLDRQMKWALIVVSLLTLGLLIAAALTENVFPEWRSVRLEYARILEEKATDERGREIAAQLEIGIDQNVVPSLNVIDRCITCHTGLEDPRMVDQENPFRTHPGGILENHPPERFGCTVCHHGQGRATESEAAHGEDEHWLYPMYEAEFMYASCGQCHERESLFTKDFLTPDDADAPRPGFALLAHGKDLLETKGCLGCHILDGQGGSLGPDITYVGDKTRHDFDFSHLDKHEPRRVAYWLEKHFLKPKEISPATVMPNMNLSEADAAALTGYVLSLKSPILALPYRVPIPLDQQPITSLSGEDLYLMMCSACHGSDGRESDVPGIRTPALNNVDFLAVASDDYLRSIIYDGRSNTAMPEWGEESNNFSHREIDLLVDHIRQWEPDAPALEDIRTQKGDPNAGHAYYQGLCANCHGKAGEGGIGNTLNSSTFLSVVSEDFLAETIIQGLPGTAMASWKHLPGQAVRDLVAYIQSWRAEAPSFDAVQAARALRSREDNARVGKILFQGNCATCHGPNGEGGIGPALNSRDVLPIVDDPFLYRTITEGRPTTAMPAWRQLSADKIGALMDYMRSWQNGERVTVAQAPPRGDYGLGKIHFETSCAECHGNQAEGGVGPQLANAVFLSAASDDVLFHWISKGRTGTAMKGFAPEEQGITRLTDENIADVIAFLRNGAARSEPPVHRSGVGNPVLGKELFKGNCVSCHGEDGEGASGPQLHNPTFLRTASDGFLAATIVLGRTGTPMRSMIHGQEGLGQIAPEEVQDLIAYMRLWDYDEVWAKPRSVAELSERAINAGRKNFGQFCAGCHGPTGLGAGEGEDYFAPALNNPEFLGAASDGFLLATIARGRSRTPMRPFGIGTGGIAQLDAGEISDIVSYIRTWQESYTPQGD